MGSAINDELKKSEIWQYSHQMCLDVLTMTRGWSRETSREWIQYMRNLSVWVERNVIDGLKCKNAEQQNKFWEVALEASVQIHESTTQAVGSGMATEKEAKHALQRSQLVIRILQRKLGLDVDNPAEKAARDKE